MGSFSHVDQLYIVAGTAMLVGAPEAYRDVPLGLLPAGPNALLTSLAWHRVAYRYAGMGSGSALLDGWPIAAPAPAPAAYERLRPLLGAVSALEVHSVTVSRHDGWTAVHLTARQEDGAAGVEQIASKLDAPAPVRRSNATHDWLATSVSPDESLAIMITGDWRTR